MPRLATITTTRLRAHTATPDIVERLQSALADNDLYIKTWSKSYDNMQALLLDAYTVLAFAFNRIHVLPRAQDTELANDIAKVRARDCRNH